MSAIWKAYAVAVMSTVVVGGTLFAAKNSLDLGLQAAPLLLPVFLASVMGGVGPGLLATALAVAVYGVVFDSLPFFLASWSDFTAQLRQLSLVIEGGLISLLGGAWRKAHLYKRLEKDKQGELRKEMQRRQDMEAGLNELAQSCERKLRELEVLYTTAPVALCFLDTELRVVRLNRQMAEMSNLPIADQINRRFAECNPSLAEVMLPSICTALETGREILDLEVSGVSAIEAETSKTWLTNYVPVRDEDGRIFGIHISIDDITDIKRAASQLRESEQKYRMLTELSPQFVWLADVDGSLHYANQYWVDYGGLPLDQTIGDGWVSLMHPEDRGRVLAAYGHALRSGTPYETEVRLKQATSDQYRWHLARALPLRNDIGEISQWMGICMDIHDLKSAEEKLQQSVRIYQAIGDSVDYGIWISAPDGRNIYVSESFQTLVGLTQEQCRDFGWQEALAPADAKAYRSAWEQCLQRGCEIWNREIKVKGVDGHWHFILSRGVPVKNESGESIYWAGVNLDIDRLKRAVETLREVGQRKDAFFAVLAHELRNPLTPILTVAQMLQRRGHLDAETVSWGANTIETQVKHLTRLVDDLLDVSRIARGKLQLAKRLVDLNAIVSLADEACRPAFSQRQQQLNLSLSEEPLWVLADTARLSQVLQNLLLNAAKFTPVNGYIEIGTKREAQKASVYVRDNGIGIGQQELENIFEPFAQVKSPGNGQQSGLGIGLALAKSLVELHEGEIHAFSGGEGKGSEFVVTLPAVPAPITSDSDERSATIPQHCDKKRVLLVDDNPSVVETLGRLLREQGYQVISAERGQEAIELARRSKPDFALIDIGLPDIDGYQVATRLRADPALEGIMLIAMTGYGKARDERYARRQGFDHFVNKPVETERVLRLLANA